MEKIVLVDDEAETRRMTELGLRAAGFQVLTASDGEAGLKLIRVERPRVVLVGLMMARLHGFAVCQEIRKDPHLRGIYIIVTSAKSYERDIKKAKELGADAYLVKPYDLKALVEMINKVLGTPGLLFRVKFWGTRGSIATPGPATLRYGGNTSCTEVRCGNNILLLDCGTGAREAGIALSREFGEEPLHVHLLVGHTHWDHIQGFPFFAPVYMPGNKFSIYSLRGSDKSLEKVFTGQMDSSYFPVNLSDLQSQLQFIELAGPVEIGDAKVSHIYLNHPELAIAFRIDYGGKGESVRAEGQLRPPSKESKSSRSWTPTLRRFDSWTRTGPLYRKHADVRPDCGGFGDSKHSAHGLPLHTRETGFLRTAE